MEKNPSDDQMIIAAIQEQEELRLESIAQQERRDRRRQPAQQYLGHDRATGRSLVQSIGGTGAEQIIPISNTQPRPGAIGRGFAGGFDTGRVREPDNPIFSRKETGDIAVLASVKNGEIWEIWLGGDRPPELITTLPVQPQVAYLELVSSEKTDWIIALKYNQTSLVMMFGATPDRNWTLTADVVRGLSYQGRGYWTSGIYSYPPGTFLTTENTANETHYTGFVQPAEAIDPFSGTNEYHRVLYAEGQYVETINRVFSTQVYAYSAFDGQITQYVGSHAFDYEFFDERDTVENNFSGQTIDTGLDIVRTIDRAIAPGVLKLNSSRGVRAPNQFASEFCQLTETLYFPDFYFLEGYSYQKSTYAGEIFCNVISGFYPPYQSPIESKIYLNYRGQEIELEGGIGGLAMTWQMEQPYPVGYRVYMQDDVFEGTASANVEKVIATVSNGKLTYQLTETLQKRALSMSGIIGEQKGVLSAQYWSGQL